MNTFTAHIEINLKIYIILINKKTLHFTKNLIKTLLFVLSNKIYKKDNDMEKQNKILCFFAYLTE